MNITLWSMGTSMFFKIKKVNSRNINKCFGGKMYLIITNTNTIEYKFYTEYNFLRIKYFR